MNRFLLVPFLPALLASSAAAGTFPEPPAGTSLTSAAFPSPAAVPIPDLGMGQSSIAVTGLAGVVWDANVVLGISHTSPYDLRVDLIAPSGREIRLAVGVSRSLFGLTLDDSATAPVSSSEGTFAAPEAAFAGLRGEDPNGTWTVRCLDLLIADSGTLTWQLEIATVDPEPPPHASTHVGTGATGFGVLGTTLEVDAVGYVCDVDVTVRLTHPDPEDLSLVLESPGGERSCYLIAGRGVVPDFYGAVTFDDASTELARYAPENAPLGVVSPLASLGIFTDLEASGAWKLSIGSSTPGPIELAGWEITITTSGGTPPVALCTGAAPAPCPCGNQGGADSGCANATQPDGASLAVEVDGGGPPTVGGDVVLVARDLDPFQIVLLVQGTQAAGGGTGVPFGDGLLCAGGQVRRLATRYSGFGSTSYPGLFDQPLWQRGGIPRTMGGTRVYQALYRSPLLFGPCHTGMNATNGVRVTWLPEEP